MQILLCFSLSFLYTNCVYFVRLIKLFVHFIVGVLFPMIKREIIFYQASQFLRQPGLELGTYATILLMQDLCFLFPWSFLSIDCNFSAEVLRISAKTNAIALRN